MSRKVDLYFDDILEALNKIEEYLAGISLEQFQKDEKTQDAVVRNFEIIGEAAKRVPETIKQQHPEIPWRSAASMRDFLIHDYPDIVADVVWDTAVNNLPEFKRQILALLKNKIGNF